MAARRLYSPCHEYFSRVVSALASVGVYKCRLPDDRLGWCWVAWSHESMMKGRVKESKWPETPTRFDVPVPLRCPSSSSLCSGNHSEYTIHHRPDHLFLQKCLWLQKLSLNWICPWQRQSNILHMANICTEHSSSSMTLIQMDHAQEDKLQWRRR